MADAHKNFATSLVATAPSPATTGTSLVVAAGQGALFPTVPFNATIWPVSVQPLTTNAEIVRVTNITTDTLTIVRAQESSSARTVVVGDQIAATITKKTLDDAEAGITAATPSTAAGRDASGNINVNNALEGYTTTATAAGTTTLVVGSTRQQYFTGTTTQIVALPVTSTLVLGQQFEIKNLSTGIVTINSSGGNAVLALPALSTAIVTVILTSGTSAASWSVSSYLNTPAAGGGGAMTLLKANSGTSTAAGATEVDTQAISGLTAKDTLVFYYNVRSVTQATADVSIFSSTNGTHIARALAGGAIPANGTVIGNGTLRQAQDAATSYNGFTIDGELSAAAATVDIRRATSMTAWTGSWTIALRHGGVTSGGTLQWSWALYKVAGQ